MTDEQPPKLNVKSYGMSFRVPKEMAEELQQIADEARDQFAQATYENSFNFMDFKPPPPPTRVQRLRTWFAERLLKVVGWLDYNVIPYD